MLVVSPVLVLVKVAVVFRRRAVVSYARIVAAQHGQDLRGGA